jgi:hypothetical protein
MHARFKHVRMGMVSIYVTKHARKLINSKRERFKCTLGVESWVTSLSEKPRPAYKLN